MMDKNQVYNDEMEQMRQDMSELRSLLSCLLYTSDAADD